MRFEILLARACGAHLMMVNSELCGVVCILASVQGSACRLASRIASMVHGAAQLRGKWCRRAGTVRFRLHLVHCTNGEILNACGACSSQRVRTFGCTKARQEKLSAAGNYVARGFWGALLEFVLAF